MTTKMKDHHTLKITFAEWLALIGVRNAMASGGITHDANGQSSVVPNEHTFNMNCTGKVYNCGSVACIGGYMAMAMGVGGADEISDYVYGRERLRTLFFPSKCGHIYEKITPKHAIKAIDNFLTSGAPKWRDVLKGLRKSR